jgi:hypothetical protein
MNWKGWGRKRSWLNLSYYPSIFLEGLRKTTKNFSQDTRSPGRDLNPGPPEFEAGVLTTQARRSVASYRVLGTTTNGLSIYNLYIIVLGRSPTDATRLRFDQEKSRLHLIHGESSSHRGRVGEEAPFRTEGSTSRRL